MNKLKKFKRDILRNDGDHDLDHDSITITKYKSFPKSKYGKLLKVIGSGTTSTVKLYELKNSNSNTENNNNNSTLFAIKEYHLKDSIETDEDYKFRILNEIKIHKSISSKNNENIIKFIDFFNINKPLSNKKNHYNYVLEYIPNSLDFIINLKSTTLLQKLCFFKQILNGVLFLQLNNINHRDLKLENCVVDLNGIVKLIDFGSSNFNNSKSFGLIGSKILAAPEIFKNLSYNSKISDIWSIGCILNKILFNKYAIWRIADPLQDSNFENYINNNNKSLNCIVPNLDIWCKDKQVIENIGDLKAVEDKVGGILLQMLEYDVNKRITMDEIMNNEWIQQINCCKTDNLIKQHQHQHSHHHSA
ncbi:hypothetical protein CANARDRAFT_200646 [[Candida] arabinofermentans NRRL YB-2248]|uniref:Protein kinase domain-containing protein n=1 Tax=[Candida] arabinofermentans NRRL YB-2248 TaxID=983967 RepID=A0A1E4SYU1_9ASCO|nr:hypothetical protein CANARDRAFT_200646 [[Candida] arabinofermentans NRRL YB-2248]